MYTTYTGERVRLRPWHDREESSRAMVATTLEANPWWGPQWYPGSAEYFDGAGLLHPSGHSSFAVDTVDGSAWLGFEDCGGLAQTGLDAWVGTYILPEHQGQGYGTEAKQLMLCYLFENYPLHVVWADTVASHRPARTSLERCGMRYTGCLSGVLFSQGARQDKVFYQITREQWEQMEYRRNVVRGT
jgi:RimJ/RimL family protein N-acetyltransferase